MNIRSPKAVPENLSRYKSGRRSQIQFRKFLRIKNANLILSFYLNQRSTIRNAIAPPLHKAHAIAGLDRDFLSKATALTATDQFRRRSL